MANNYSIEAKNGVTTIRLYKETRAQDIRNAIDAVAEKNIMNELRLWDLSRLNSDFTNDQLHQLAEYSKSRFVLPSRAAIVAPSKLVYGLSKIYEAYREEGLVKHRVFKTEDEARIWLSK